jgi:trans-aconitate 2-methyltransferase
MSGSEYSFGDSELACERLGLLARIFERSTRAFLERSAPKRPRLALDLGCGPGFSTRLLAPVVEAEQTIGLDSSEAFIALAREHEDERIRFLRHDVTEAPFPTAPPELVFARLLLSHLGDTEPLLARWAAELAPDGLVLVEEVDRIDSSVETFTRYLTLIAERMSASGGELYRGLQLDSLRQGSGFRRLSSEPARVAPATAEVAAMFRLNLLALRQDGRLDGLGEPAELDRLERELTELKSSSGQDEIVWALRQVVFAAK